MKLPIAALLTLVCCACMGASQARAAFPAQGVKLITGSSVAHAEIRELPSGEFVVLTTGNGGTSFHYGILHIGREGVAPAGWAGGSFEYGSLLKSLQFRLQSAALDSVGALWHIYTNGGTRADLVGALSTTAFNNLPVMGSFAPSVRALHAPNGDAFIATGNRLQRFTRAGVVASGWAAAGVALPNVNGEDTALQPADGGGVYVFLRNSSSFGVAAVTRVDGNGLRHTGWPFGGRVLTDQPPAAQAVVDCTSRLLPSGPQHFVALWEEATLTSGTTVLLAQRFDRNGIVDPAWGPTAHVIATSTSFANMLTLPDGSGGVYVLRDGASGPTATHLLVSGTLSGSPETPLMRPGDVYAACHSLVDTHFDDLIGDVTPAGQLVVGWNDARNSPAVEFRFRWWNRDLTPDASKPAEGLRFVPGTPLPTPGGLMALRADGEDAAFIVWDDDDVADPLFQQPRALWMARVQASAPVGVTPHATGVLALSSPYPNPSRGSVEFEVVLGDPASAQLELLDVAGRRVRQRWLAGTGRQTVRFDDLAPLPAGLYLARLQNEGETRVTRFVITH